MPSEVWKPVPIVPGYEISDQGRLRHYRFPTYLHTIRRRGRFRRNVRLVCADGKARTFPLSRLVLLAFKGPPPPDCEGCHNDGNPANNRLENLRWDTHRGNMQDTFRHGTDTSGGRHPLAKLSRREAQEILKLIGEGWKHTDLARRFGVSITTISYVRTGKHWTRRGGGRQERRK